MKVAVIGLGYVGAVTALALASKRGFDVVGIDSDRDKVASFSRLSLPFYEPGLGALLEKATKSRRFRATEEYGDCADRDVVFLAVGTPSAASGALDLSYVKAASRELGKIIRTAGGRMVVVVKSTVMPGTTRTVVKSELERTSGKQAGRGFGLASNPEFLAEGSAVRDMLSPSRIVVGALDAYSARAVRALYSSFYGSSFMKVNYVQTTPENAELTKSASNTMLSIRVSFINELARICEGTPFADVDAVALGVGLDRRIGRPFLKAGPGWGGSCFRKDVSALLDYARKSTGREPAMIKANLQTNVDQKKHVAEILEKSLGGLEGMNVAVLGITFKAGTDDIRDSQAFEIVSSLVSGGSRVRCFDPNAKALSDFSLQLSKLSVPEGSVGFAKTAGECVQGCDAAVVLTDWKEFSRLGPSFFAARLAGRRVLLDTRRIYYKKKSMRTGSFRYLALGVYDERGTAGQTPFSSQTRGAPSLISRGRV